MSNAGNEHAPMNTAVKIILWGIGLGVVGLIALPILVVLLLVVVAMIGGAANQHLENQANSTPTPVVSVAERDPS